MTAPVRVMSGQPASIHDTFPRTNGEMAVKNAVNPALAGPPKAEARGSNPFGCANFQQLSGKDEAGESPPSELCPGNSRAAAFHLKVGEPSGPHGCMEWTGGRNSWGYGLFKVRTERGRVNRLAHRVAYAMAKGDPGKLFVRHACDNPLCCNPAHLSLGTQRDNEHDKGRSIEERLSIINISAQESAQ